MLVGLDFDNTIVCYDRLFHRLADAGGRSQQVIEEAILVVVATGSFERVHDEDHLLQEFDDHVVIDRILLSQRRRESEHRNRVVRHPCGSVCLVEPDSGRQVGTIEGTDVVQSQETAAKEVVAFRILAVEPPREIQQQLLEYSLKEFVIRGAVNYKDSDRCQSMDRRIDVIETPFVRRKRAVRMKKPFSQQHK